MTKVASECFALQFFHFGDDYEIDFAWIYYFQILVVRLRGVLLGQQHSERRWRVHGCPLSTGDVQQTLVVLNQHRVYT